MEKRLPTFEDCYGVERMNGGDYCEAKSLVCYASNRTNGIVVKNLKTKEKTLVTAGGRGEADPAFSPDGSRLLFFSVIPGKGRQLFVCELETMKVIQVTQAAGTIMDPVWSPDSKRILFQTMTSGNKEKKESPKHADDAVVIEDFGYKFDGVGFYRPDTHWHLSVAEADGSLICTQLTDGDFDYLHGNWSPDGSKVVCVSNRYRSRKEGIGYDLLLLDAQTGTEDMVRLSEGFWLVSYPNPLRPVFLPDGKSVIAGVLNPEYAENDAGHGYPEIYFYRFYLDQSAPKAIFVSDETCYQCVQFPYNACCGTGMDKVQISEDGKEVYFVSGWKGQGNLYRLSIEGDGHAALLYGGRQVCHGLSRVQNGKMMLTHSTSSMPETYEIIDIESGRLIETAAMADEALRGHVLLSDPEDFTFDTLDGESSVHGWVLAPQEREEGKKYPAILYIHGGPHPFYTYGLTMEFQLLAAQGFVVLYCNPRGSSGYGWTHQNYARSVDGSAYYDLLQFVDEACRRFPWIDKERIGATGGSYGGYMTNYMATHCKRFKAYVTQRSISNELISYANSDMQGESLSYRSYEDFMVAKLKESAVSYAERVDRPILILHGMDDYRTPVEGAHQFYVALKDLHPELPIKMLLFPHTGHDQPSDKRQLKRYYQEMADWFKKYLV